ncbi:ABC transporter ATP-binding protein [Hydrogenivirga sp. 128-5-R1-1]|uniref:ABC transporter ATP-binding protein n=1 Tax=Hydrogenivirga sp. 128-5-R1-1 TaxID=392423 RepID=UPI00015EEF1E|nr:ABC transporter ATP-binding protein [Hydrogenivirga sp. 128-5-R1-1]EDP73773.1 ABC transporter [Hydrogenivirga sp. 128-5-R1-1]
MRLNKSQRGQKPLLSIKNLKVSFSLENQTIKALKGISLEVYPKEIVCLVGESGSGKSITCYSVLKLLDKNAKVDGKISFKTDNKNIENLLTLSDKKVREIRGNEISMVFQEPSAVLNPLLTVGQQLIETVLAHRKVNKDEAKKICLNAMEKAQIPDPERRFYQYPHELSGGLKQRVAIAIAVVNNPYLILADEPTTALDVTVSAKILSLFKKIKKEGKSILLITHDLGVVAEVADWVYVIKNGEIVEENNVYEIFEILNTHIRKIA